MPRATRRPGPLDWARLWLVQITGHNYEWKAPRGRRTEDHVAARQRAERRARALLRSHLTKRQNQTLTDQNCFAVRGSKTGQTYLIYGLRRSHLGQNITDTFGFKYGVGLTSQMPFFAHWTEHPHPPSDVMLAQKLLIETDEPKFLRIACKSRVK